MAPLRRAAAALVAASLAGLTAASAASLGGVDVNGFGAGSAVIASCDTDGVTLDHVLALDDATASYVVTHVDVSGIDAACVGADVSVVLSGAGSRLATGGPVAVDAATERLALDNAAAAEQVDRASVLLDGP